MVLDAIRRPHRLLAPTVSYGSAAQPALATFRLGECDRDFSGGDMVFDHLPRRRLQRASLSGSTGCTTSRGGRGRFRDCGASQCEGGRAPADQVAALCWADLLCRQRPPYRLLLLLVGREVVGVVGKLSICGSWWLERPHRHWRSHTALQTLRYRHPHKSHSCIRLIDHHAGRALLRRHRSVAEVLRLADRPAVDPGNRGLDYLDSGVVCSIEASHPVLHRSALLPQQV